MFTFAYLLNGRHARLADPDTCILADIRESYLVLYGWIGLLVGCYAWESGRARHIANPGLLFVILNFQYIAFMILEHAFVIEAAFSLLITE